MKDTAVLAVVSRAMDDFPDNEDWSVVTLKAGLDHVLIMISSNIIQQDTGGAQDIVIEGSVAQE